MHALLLYNHARAHIYIYIYIYIDARRIYLAPSAKYSWRRAPNVVTRQRKNCVTTNPSVARRQVNCEEITKSNEIPGALPSMTDAFLAIVVSSCKRSRKDIRNASNYYTKFTKCHVTSSTNVESLRVNRCCHWLSMRVDHGCARPGSPSRRYQNPKTPTP